MFPLIFGIIAGSLSALGAFSSSMLQGSAQRQQAEQMRAQANIARREADIERQKGDLESRQIDRQKSALRAEFEEAQAKNRASLGAGNIDMYSGSALDTSLGNINAFALDAGDNAYKAALRQWEAKETQKKLRYQADVYDANASYLSKTAANVGTSLLTAAISGGTGFLGGYSLAGGSVSSLFGSAASDYTVSRGPDTVQSLLKVYGK